jgi:hypothetical protein
MTMETTSIITAKSRKETSLTCTACKMPIMEGESLWSVNVSRETCEAERVTVHETQCLHTFCGSCAQKRRLAS